MTDSTPSAESDPRHYSQKIKLMLNETAKLSREDVSKVSDPQARALFETTAEVLIGLVNAYNHFEQKSEQAWI